MIRTFFSLITADYKKTQALYLVLAVVSVLLRAAGVVLVVPVVAILLGEQPAAALPWVLALTVVTVLGWVVDRGVFRAGYALGFGILESQQAMLASRVANTELSWFTAANTAAARTVLASTGSMMTEFIMYLFTPLLSAALLPAVLALAMLPISWPLGVAMLVAIPVLLVSLWGSTAISQRANTSFEKASVEFNERLIEFSKTQAALRSNRRVGAESGLVSVSLNARQGALARLLVLQIPGQILLSLVSQIVLVALAALTIYLALTGELSVPAAIAATVVLVRFLEPFAAVAALGPAIEVAKSTLENIQQVLDAPQIQGDVAQSDEAGAQVVSRDAPSIEFEGVSFSYPGSEQPVLENLSFSLEPGSANAIVGPSGSGKSTIVLLIAGLIHPQRGRVLIGGTDIRTLDAASRRALSTMVFQQPYLFQTTIAENIRSGNPEASEAEVKLALKRARVLSILETLPKGIDTVVGEGGATLSGGERQRITIARALLKPAPLLLVDEGTSALDNENEAALVDALKEDSPARTTVLVAHRLSSIQNVDRVLFLERGRILEDGSVPELLAQGERFASFWQQQLDSQGWQVGA